jgi:nucleoside-diphosphate-sugar epimerase
MRLAKIGIIFDTELANRMTIKGKRIIILGTSGFIGKNLYRKFKSDECEVTGFSSRELNLLSQKEVEQKLAGVTLRDVIVLAAAITRLRENTFNSMIRNIRMIENIAAFMRKHPVGHVVYLSTIDVYGVDIPKGEKINEKNEFHPNDYYAISKLTGEFLLRQACTSMDVPLTIFRLCGIYGPEDSKISMIGSMAAQALQRNKITVYGDGKNLRDYVHINDLYALLRASICRKLNITVNVATGRSYSIIAIARIIKSFISVRIAVEFKPIPKIAERRIKDMQFDCSRLKNAFGRIKLMDIRDGIAFYLRQIQGWRKT